jgi:DNA-binding transcriptional LysR family regulator
MIGQSPFADPSWISAILATHLPLYPKLRIRFTSEFPVELVRSVLAGELNLGLMTAPPLDSQITVVPFARAQVNIVLSESHRVAHKEHVVLQDIAEDEWIVFARRLDPIVHDAIMDAARSQRITCKCAHDVTTAEQAIHLVSEQLGVAILIQPGGLSFRPEGVVVKALSDTSLCFESCLIMRADDDSRLVNELARSFLRRFPSQRISPEQMELPFSHELQAPKRTVRTIPFPQTRRQTGR